MQKEQSSRLVTSFLALADVALLMTAFHLAVWLRFGSLANRDQFIWLFYLSAPMILVLLLRSGVLTGLRYQRLRDIVRHTVYAFLVTGAACTAVLYLSKTGEYSRLVFGYYFGLAAFFVLLEKTIVKNLYDRYLARGGMNVRIAVVGFGTKCEEIVKELRERPELGLAPVLLIDPRHTDIGGIVSQIRQAVTDEVYLVYPHGAEYHYQIDEILNRLETVGLPVRVALNFDELQDYYSQHLCDMGSKSTGVLLAPYNLNPDQLLLKRIMDLVGATLGLVITALIYPVIGLAIKVESPGPVLFSQRRVGKGGRQFRIYKFRSMYPDAEARKAELKAQNIHEGALFKVENDPRITRVGRVIRKYSLDEFPQFWNVLKGEMSLVGTRPPTLDEVSQYEDHHFRRISIKPGLTGLWQVSGRNAITDFDEIVKLDAKYISEWNLLMDMRILLLTLKIVLFPKGSNAGM